MAGEFRRIDPKKRRKDRSTTVTLPNGDQIKCKRIDMTLMVMQGLVPLPLLGRVQKLIEDGTIGTPVGLALALTEQEKAEMLDMMRRHASVVAIDPRVVMKDDGKEDVLLAEDLDLQELTEIWVATSITPAPAVAASVDDFRDDAPRPDADAAPSGPDVQPATEQLAGTEFKGA